MRKRLLAWFMAVCMITSVLPVSAFAVDCEHHETHTADCGYREAVAGASCTHECGADCYTVAAQCTHFAHDENCGWAAATEDSEELPCGHVCDTACETETQVLRCSHEHDENCGYVAAVEGVACKFVCNICSGTNGGEDDDPVCTGDETCTLTEGHKEGCPKAETAVETKVCTEAEGCEATEHKDTCPMYVLACDKTAECKAADHAEDCPVAIKAAAQLTFDEMVAALPAPGTVDPLNEEMLKTLDEQIKAIAVYAVEKGLYARVDGVACHPVIAALLEAMHPTDVTETVAKVGEMDYDSLDDAIDAVATSGGTVTLTADATIGKTHTISGNVTIEGAKHTVTYADGFTAGLFTVNQGATLTVKNVTIDGGYVGSLDFANWKNPGNANRNDPTKYPLIDEYETDDAYPIKTGSMFTNKGTLNIDGAIIQNFISVRQSNPGVIIAPSGDGTVTTLSNSTIQNCITNQSGVLYYNYGGIPNAKLTITDCTITKNYGWTRGSLIVDYSSNNFTLSIENTSITKNGAGGTSYAMILAEKASGISVRLTNCHISENVGTYGIVETRGTFTMEGTTIENNSLSSYSVYLYGDKINITSGTIKEEKPVVFLIDATIESGVTIEADIKANEEDSNSNIYNNGTIKGNITLSDGKYIEIGQTGSVEGSVSGSVKVRDALITPPKSDDGKSIPLKLDTDGNVTVPVGTEVTITPEDADDVTITFPDHETLIHFDEYGNISIGTCGTIKSGEDIVTVTSGSVKVGNDGSFCPRFRVPGLFF